MRETLYYQGTFFPPMEGAKWTIFGGDPQNFSLAVLCGSKF